MLLVGALLFLAGAIHGLLMDAKHKNLVPSRVQRVMVEVVVVKMAVRLPLCLVLHVLFNRNGFHKFYVSS